MLNKFFSKEPAMKTVVSGALALFCILVVTPLFSHALLQLTVYPARQGFYAVFLTNGQVYFGSVSKEDENHLVMNDVYYVQLKNGSGTSPTTNDASLIKLGNEFHTPEDMMEINRSQILFIEKLKAEGNVAKAIDAAKQKS